MLKRYDDSPSQISESTPLPRFNGNTADWLEFFDILRSLIYEHESLADIQQFFYLQGALEYNASAAAIKKVQSTANN